MPKHDVTESKQIENNEIVLSFENGDTKASTTDLSHETFSSPITNHTVAKKEKEVKQKPSKEKPLFVSKSKKQVVVKNDQPGFFDADGNPGIILAYKSSEILTSVINPDKRKHNSVDNKRDFIKYEVFDLAWIGFKVIAEEVELISPNDMNMTKKMLRGKLTVVDSHNAFISEILMIPLIVNVRKDKTIVPTYKIKLNISTNSSIAKFYPFPTLSDLVGETFKHLQKYFNNTSMVTDFAYDFYPNFGQDTNKAMMDPRKYNKEIKNLVGSTKIKAAKQSKTFANALKSIEKITHKAISDKRVLNKQLKSTSKGR